MRTRRLFPFGSYLRKMVNTFGPRSLFRLSPNRAWARNHWRGQREGDIHGYDKYTVDHPRVPILIRELGAIAGPGDRILDLGCNCGYYLHLLKKEGYTNLHGIDISPEAVAFGKRRYDLAGVGIRTGSFEECLPAYAEGGRSFDVVYSLGATLELVHPSFDIIAGICRIADRYVLLIISEWGHAYPRFWEYEFNRNGFLLVRALRPFDGSHPAGDPGEMDSLLLFERVQDTGSGRAPDR